jgi:hypothetical protein
MTRFSDGKESDLKSQIIDYLQILENMGVCLYERINAGELVVLNKDGTKRLVKLARKGCADVLCIIYGRAIFIETKSKTGKQSDDQKEFQVKAESVSAIYWLIYDFDDFKNRIDKIINIC